MTLLDVSSTVRGPRDTFAMSDSQHPKPNLRDVPTQEPSRERLRQVLDAAEQVLAEEGAGALTMARIAEVAGVSGGSPYQYFPDKESIVDALAVRYWSDFEDLVAGVAEADEHDPIDDPAGAILATLAAGFRARPGFLALWYGGLRTQRVRDTTRVTRAGVARSVEQILAVHWPRTDPALRTTVARMVVLTGDGLLREAFRVDPAGSQPLLDESARVIEAYMTARLGERSI